MALQVAVGTFDSPGATGSQSYDILDQDGNAFQPKAVLIFSSDVTDVANDTPGDGAPFTVGCSTGSSNEWSFGSWAVDNSATAAATRIWRNTSTISVRNGTSGNQFVADLTSLDADGFTLNWTVVTVGSGRAFHYVALGGSDLTDAVAGTHQLPTSGATTTVTGLSFQPTALLVVHTNNESAGTPGVDTFFGMGWTDGTDEGCLMWGCNDGDTNMQNARQQRTDAIISTHNPNGEAAVSRAAFSAFTSDGFTLSISQNPGAAQNFGYLALAGPSVKVGTVTQPTSTGSQPTSGLGFSPDVLLLMSYCAASSSSVQAHARMSLGASNGVTTQGAAMHDTDAVGTSVTAHVHSATDAFLALTANATGSSSTLDAKASITSLDSDGFTLNYTAADATQREILYFTLGVSDIRGHGVAGLIGAGTSSSEFAETGTGVVGAVGSGTKEFVGATVYIKTGFGVVGLVGSGAKQVVPAGSVSTKAGFGKVGTTTAGGSTLHEDVVPFGVSIAFGDSVLNPYPQWVRIDPERP